MNVILNISLAINLVASRQHELCKKQTKLNFYMV
jgi:hypothetical protein